MQVTLYLTTASLNSSQEGLENYVAALTEAILKEYPEIDVVHEEKQYTYAFRVTGTRSDEDYGYIVDHIQLISENVYENGDWV